MVTPPCIEIIIRWFKSTIEFIDFAFSAAGSRDREKARWGGAPENQTFKHSTWPGHRTAGTAGLHATGLLLHICPSFTALHHSTTRPNYDPPLAAAAPNLNDRDLWGMHAEPNWTTA